MNDTNNHVKATTNDNHANFLGTIAHWKRTIGPYEQFPASASPSRRFLEPTTRRFPCPTRSISAQPSFSQLVVSVPNAPSTTECRPVQCQQRPECCKRPSSSSRDSSSEPSASGTTRLFYFRPTSQPAISLGTFLGKHESRHDIATELAICQQRAP